MDTAVPTWLEMPDDFHVQTMPTRIPPPSKPPLDEIEQDDLERCAFCGCLLENPCDSPPPDICERAINALYLKDLLKSL